MSDLEEQIRELFLDHMESPDWHAEDPRLDFGSQAIPYFVTAFHNEQNPQLRALLTCIIWQLQRWAFQSLLQK